MYAWHNKTIESTTKQFMDNRLAHALLLNLRPGFFDEEIVEAIKFVLLCDYNGSKPNCNCQHCLLINQQTHPNIYELDAKNKISINDIRQLEQQIWQTAVFPKNKFIIIHHIDLISNNAQNALLKTLEEPPINTIFLLSTNDKNRVLPTILSRTQKLQIPHTETKEIKSWLIEQNFTDSDIEYALKNSKNPQQALQILNNPEHKDIVESDKKSFFLFVNRKISAYSFVKKINFDDYVTALNTYIGYTNKLIMLLLHNDKNQSISSTALQQVDAKELYILRDMLLDLIFLSKTNCNIELQTKNLLNRWQNDRPNRAK